MKELEYEIKVEKGNIVLSLKYDGKGMDGLMQIQLEGEYFLDKLAEAIPSKYDDMIFEALKLAMKK